MVMIIIWIFPEKLWLPKKKRKQLQSKIRTNNCNIMQYHKRLKWQQILRSHSWLLDHARYKRYLEDKQDLLNSDLWPIFYHIFEHCSRSKSEGWQWYGCLNILKRPADKVEQKSLKKLFVSRTDRGKPEQGVSQWLIQYLEIQWVSINQVQNW